jgi:hypothetical protein
MLENELLTWHNRVAESKISSELLDLKNTDKCARLARLEMAHNIKEAEIAELEIIAFENESFAKRDLESYYHETADFEEKRKLGILQSGKIPLKSVFIANLIFLRKLFEGKRKTCPGKRNQTCGNEEVERAVGCVD